MSSQDWRQSSCDLDCTSRVFCGRKPASQTEFGHDFGYNVGFAGPLDSVFMRRTPDALARNFLNTPSPLRNQGGIDGVFGKEWWAIEDSNLRLLPCGGRTGRRASRKNKAKPCEENDLSVFLVFDTSRFFSIFFDRFRYFWAHFGRKFLRDFLEGYYALIQTEDSGNKKFLKMRG